MPKLFTMRTKGIKQLTGISSTPIRYSSYANWMANFPISMSSYSGSNYQQNQTQKNPNFDTYRKLVIQNYSKDLGSAVFYGWDLVGADEMEDAYLFQLTNRENSKLKVYITLGRELQISDLENNLHQMYQCYMHDEDGDWHETFWLGATDINHKSFWGKIERLVDKHHPLYPF